MEAEILEVGSFVFESREAYDLAKKEEEMIQELKDKVDLTEPKNAFKVYNRLVTERKFNTVIGYSFLLELRKNLIEKQISTPEALKEIQVREQVKKAADTLPVRPAGESRYKRLYEIQKNTNTKFKIILIALVIFLIGAVIITVRTKYSVFTYFTDYKTNMENEIIDQYEHWEEELKRRENELNK